MNEDIPSVCVITQPARREGSKTHASQLLDILAAITSVSLLTANLDPESPIQEEYDVIELTSEGTGTSLPVVVYRFLRNQVLMARAVTNRDEDVILFFGATAYLLPMVVARAVGKRVVVEPRGDVPLSLRLSWEKQMPTPLAQFLAGLVSFLEHAGYTIANAVVTYTPTMASQLGLEPYRHKLYTDAARYVNTEEFTVQTGFDDRPLTVGYLGRLDVEKDVPTLVEVAKRLPDDVQFRFVGDGDYRTVIEEELSEDIDSGRVTITGWVDHDAVPEQLNEMRLLLLSSEPTEGLPTAILESFACGTPVYATPVSGVPDVVREGQTGFLMDDRDPEVIASTIERALDAEMLPAMSDSCRAVAETEFSFEAAVERYRHILHAVES